MNRRRPWREFEMRIFLRVLIVDDSEDDTLLLVRQLTRGGACAVEYERVDTERAMLEALERPWDLIICDYAMPHFSGTGALGIFRARNSEVPFIFVSGNIQEEVAIAALEQGAQDYIMKTNMKRLNVAVKRVLREAQERREEQCRSKKSEKHLSEIVRRLESALAQKTVLLQEVHHRVKNNLTVIASLLGMQVDTITDPQARQVLLESQQQVYSMALVHEYLYGVDNLDRIRMDEYAERLAAELHMAFSSPSRIQVLVEAEPIELGVDKAIPCGLTLNELLTNAMKYAFPNGRSGVVTVGFTRTDAGWACMSVHDDGVGMRAGFDWRNAPSLGLQIVQLLAKQLDGRLELDCSHGTRFSLIFPSS